MTASRYRLDQYDSDIDICVKQLMKDRKQRLNAATDGASQAGQPNTDTGQLSPNEEAVIAELHRYGKRLEVVRYDLDHDLKMYGAGAKSLSGKALDAYRRGEDALRKDYMKTTYLQNVVNNAIGAAPKAVGPVMPDTGSIDGRIVSYEADGPATFDRLHEVHESIEALRSESTAGAARPPTVGTPKPGAVLDKIVEGSHFAPAALLDRNSPFYAGMKKKPLYDKPYRQTGYRSPQGDGRYGNR